MVFNKEFADSEEEMCELLLDADVLPPPHRPQPVAQPGLDNNRKWYLHNKIREFCTPNTVAITCPQQEEEPENVVRPVVQRSVGPLSDSRRPQIDDSDTIKFDV